MTYTSEKPRLAESSDQLRQRIPGWGADLDPKDRPAVPRERLDPNLRGTDPQTSTRQPEKWPRERSIEHKLLTPVFGTSAPPRGVAGAIRRLSYARYSEARAAHWLLLLAADRVDSLESSIRSLASKHPDNPITETGILSERKFHGIASRRGLNRADVKHHLLDPVIVGTPWVLRTAAVYGVGRRIALYRRRTKASSGQHRSRGGSMSS